MKIISFAVATLLAASPAFATPDHHPVFGPRSSTNTNNNQSSSASESSATTTNNLNAVGGQGGQGGSAGSKNNVNNTNNTDIYYPQQVPNIVGPVPRGSVPVFSIYGQMDYQQRGTYGAQFSIPLAR